VHVLQFFIFLLVAIDIEIVKPRLPKLWQLLKESRKRDPQLPSRCRTPVLPHLLGHALLQHLQHRRRRRLLRLADQQVHVIRHHHISRKQKSVFPSHLAKFFYKQISRARRAKEWHPSVTTKCDKVQLPLAVVALQSLRHHTPKPPPSQTEGGAPKPLPRYSPMNYRSGMLSPHMAVKRKERDSRAGHPSKTTYRHSPLPRLPEAPPQTYSFAISMALIMGRTGYMCRMDRYLLTGRRQQSHVIDRVAVRYEFADP